jgi:hypothetical protein
MRARGCAKNSRVARHSRLGADDAYPGGDRMRHSRLTGVGLIGLGAGLAASAILGPLGLGRITFRVSASAESQLLGGEIVSLLAAAPLALAAGLAWAVAVRAWVALDALRMVPLSPRARYGLAWLLLVLGGLFALAWGASIAGVLGGAPGPDYAADPTLFWLVGRWTWPSSFRPR